MHAVADSSAAGSEDGRVYLWGVERQEPHHMSHMTFRGPPVFCVAWSPALHCLAICTFTPMAPIQVVSPFLNSCILSCRVVQDDL